MAQQCVMHGVDVRLFGAGPKFGLRPIKFAAFSAFANALIALLKDYWV